MAIHPQAFHSVVEFQLHVGDLPLFSFVAYPRFGRLADRKQLLFQCAQIIRPSMDTQFTVWAIADIDGHAIMFITCWVKTCIFLQIFCCIAMSPCSRILQACKNTSFLSRPFSKLCEIHVPPPLTCGKCGKIRARPLNLNSKYGNLCISTPSIRALMLDPKLHLRNLLRITPGRQEAKMSKF